MAISIYKKVSKMGYLPPHIKAADFCSLITPIHHHIEAPITRTELIYRQDIYLH